MSKHYEKIDIQNMPIDPDKPIFDQLLEAHQLNDFHGVATDEDELMLERMVDEGMKYGMSSLGISILMQIRKS